MAQETTPFMSASLGSAEWQGTSRYQVLGCLGRGGMGVVYEVFDREREQPVALKTLLHFDPAGLYRFKQEFRTLADVRHANLVQLYELVIRETGEIFFTMELVRGKEFIQYVRNTEGARESVRPPTQVEGHSGVKGKASAPRVSCEMADHHPSPSRPEAAAPLRTTAVDENRLRPALRQLVAGISALHAAGKLHRDIKPANALVTAQGRVVLLDFGVATELSSHDAESADGAGQMVGTAQYMAPEQADEAAPTPAADWYSVGVMLYEALVGKPPFVGSTIDVITMKSMLEAPLPSASVDGVPPDLDALCHDLLAVEPGQRPHGDEILRRLGVDRVSSDPPVAKRAFAADHDAELIGRQKHLDTFTEALESTRHGQTLTVFVTGPSGIGKTRLVNHFLDEIVVARQAVVLRGRAYEREAVPYKAFDAVIDSLSRHLLSVIEAGEDVSLPEDAWLLSRIFPVLQRIPGLVLSADLPIEESRTVRRRAFAALRQIIGSLSRQSPVVIFVDDVHWGDADSAALLLELVRPPSAAGLLVIMTYQEAKDASPFLREIQERWPEGADRRQVAVDALDLEDARRLALSLMGATDAMAQRSARAVARESLGQPFLIEELARANLGHFASSDDQSLGIISVDDMIGERLGRLPESARRLAEVIAVGGQPLPTSVAIRAAGADPTGADELVAAVCARRFARAGLRDGRDVLEPTYDQIRERVVAQLPKERLRQHHESLALALQEAPDRDGEAVAEHWLGAGDRERAATLAQEAAEQALMKFAFDKAARLFRLALEHGLSSSPDVHSLRVRLAQALQMAGRTTESGREYMRAAATAPAQQQLELRRIASEQLLAAGRIAEGEQILREVLASCGMRAPRSPLTALFWLVVYSLWIRLRGYKFEDRAPRDVGDRDRMRVEALHTAGIGYGFVNPILATCMQKRQCVEAMRVGDRVQVLEALAVQMSHLGNASCRESERERDLIRTARDLTARIGEDESEPYVDLALGFVRYWRGQWRGAREMFERNEAAFKHAGHRGLAGNARLFAGYTCFYGGDFSEYRRRSTQLLAEAEDRGDLYTSVTLRVTAVVRLSLAMGETERGRKIAREAIEQWSQKGFSVQHWQVMINVPDLDVYDGQGGRAYDTFMQSMPVLKKSMMMGNWYVRVLTWQAWGRLAIASIASQRENRDVRIAEARKMADRLSREPNAWAVGLGSMLRASADIAAGDRTAAIAELRNAIALNDASGAEGNAIVAKLRLGRILDDDEGRDLVRGATRILREQWGVKDVERYAMTWIPGELEQVSLS